MSDVGSLPVDARWVEPFAIVATELHFTRAAQLLGVSQQALSQQIARPERQLGVVLLTRAPGAVSLTPAGEVLWREVRLAMAGLRAAIAAARSVGALRAAARAPRPRASSAAPTPMSPSSAPSTT